MITQSLEKRDFTGFIDSFSALFDKISERMVIIDSNLNILFANHTFLESYPKSADQIKKVSFIEFLKTYFDEYPEPGLLKDHLHRNREFQLKVYYGYGQFIGILLEFFPLSVPEFRNQGYFLVYLKHFSQKPLQKQIQHFEIIKKIIRNIAKIDSISNLLQYVVETLYENKFSYHHVSVFLRETDTKEEKSFLRLISIEGKSKDFFIRNYPNGYVQAIDVGIAGHVASTGEPIFEKDVQKNSSYYFLQGFKSASEVCAPVKIDEEVIGVINIESEDRMELDETDVQMLMSVADLVGLGIKNILKTEELRLRNDEMERYLADLQESKDRLENQSFELVTTLENVEKARKIIEKQNAILEKELKIGAELQKSLLPKNLPDNSVIRFDSIYIPTMQLGGDIFDVQRLDDEHLAIFIADVSGHGVSAAIIAAMLKAFYSNHLSNELDPATLLKRLNNDLNAALSTDDFVTAFSLLLNIPERRAVFSSAGHPAPLVIKSKDRKIKQLQTDGFFLGVFQDGNYCNENIQLHKKDRLLFFTDGIIEAKNSREEQFGRRRLVREMNRLRQESFTDVLNLLQNRLINFSGSPEFDDDITLLLLELT